MHKIFDHFKSYKGWFEVENPALYIEQAFNSERYCDRDGGIEYLIEHYDSTTDKITYHVAEMSGWGWGSGDDDDDDRSPSMDVFVMDTPEEARKCGVEPTKDHPMRNYLRVSKYETNSWPPKPKAA